MKAKDYIGFRDAVLRQRLEDAVKQGRGVLDMSKIIRLALEDKLTQIETKGIASLLQPPPSEEPYSARSELTNAGEHMIVRKDVKSPRGSPSRVRGK